MRKILWLACLLVEISCSTADDRTRLDSSDNLITVPKNRVQVLTLDVPWSCEEAQRKVDRKDLYMSELDMLLIMKTTECTYAQRNRNTPQDPWILVVTHAPDSVKESTNMIGMIPLKCSNSAMDSACQKFVALAGLPKDQNPAEVIVESAIGTYPLKEYLKRIQFTTPIIVLLPMRVMGYKLTPDLYQTAFHRI